MNDDEIKWSEKMKPKIKKLLVEKLRSGEYTQTTGSLRNGDAFCCLGVLCDLYAKENGIKWDGDRFLGVSSYLPKQVCAWAGVSDNGSYGGCNACLSADNDSGKNFHQIADITEGVTVWRKERK